MKRYAAAFCVVVLAIVGLSSSAVYAQDAAAALKEALTTGTSDAVSTLGKSGGYFSNPAVKIQLPGKLQMVATALRGMGYGPQIDQFVKSMNDAAEAAAPKAQPIFVNAIQSMSFSDAQQIVSKGGHSATDYFQRKTTPELTTAFTPIVKQTMEQNSVTKQYDDLMGKYSTGAMGGLGSMLGWAWRGAEFRPQQLCRQQESRWTFLYGGAGGAEDSHQSCRAGYSATEAGLWRALSEVTDFVTLRRAVLSFLLS